MKKLLSFFGAAILLIGLLTISTSAAVISGTCGDNVTWTLDSEGTLTISGTGAMADYEFYNMPWPNSQLKITKAVIENGITTIGSNAFRHCRNLTSVTIADSVTSIGTYAFSGCSGLTSVTIPDSVLTIGTGAFFECSGLISMDIPKGVNTIEGSIFYACTSLTSVTIPDSVTSIGENAFENCTGLTSITIPDSVTSIGDGAFKGCAGLTSITIPDSVTDIKDGVFAEIPTLTEIVVSESNPAYISVDGILFDKAKTRLICCPAGKLHTSYTIPDSVTSIAGYAFYGCSSLTSVTIPAGVTDIGAYTFYDCSSLTSVTIPAGVTDIDTYAFHGCSSLTSVTIPAGVADIGDGAFADCSSLPALTLPNHLTTIGSNAFYNCKMLKSMTVPEGVTTIERRAFYGCGLIDVSLPSTLTSISDGVFSNCYWLEHVTIPNGVTSIGASAFYDCSNLNSVTISDSVTSIGADAFYRSGLTSVIIPGSVTSIARYAFEQCSGLATVFFEGDAPKVPCGLDEEPVGPFYGVSASCFYPAGNNTWTETVRTSYGSMLTWAAFGRCTQDLIWTLPDAGTLRFIGSGATGNYSVGTPAPWHDYAANINKVIIDARVTDIGSYAFYGNPALTVVCFGGTQDQWDAVEIDADAFIPENATILCVPTVTVTFRASDGKPVISWTAVEGATGYELWRCNTENGIYVKSYTATADKLSVAHTAAVEGEVYLYKVRAIHDGIAGEYSAAHSNLLAPTVSIASSHIDGNAGISWTTVAGASGYELWRSRTENGEYSKLYTTSKTFYRDNDSAWGNVYFYKVRAISGNVSGEFSSVICSNCGLPAPTITVTSNASSGKPVISWSPVEGATAYIVFIFKDGARVSSITSTSANWLSTTHTAAETGVEYTYKVCALKGGVCGSFSEEKGIQAELPVPTITVTTGVSNGKPLIRWANMDDVIGYEIWHSNTETGTYIKVLTLHATDLDAIDDIFTAYTDDFMVAFDGSFISAHHATAEVGSNCFYKIRAIIDDATTGEFSEPAGAWCVLTTPGIYLDYTSDGKPLISWLAVDGAAGYEIWYCGTSSGTYTKLITIDDPDKLSVVHTGAIADNDYYYKVRAIWGANPCGNSDYSWLVGISDGLTAPTISVTTNASGNEHQISWTAVEDAAGYMLWRSESISGPYSLIYICGPDRLSTTRTVSTEGCNYFYKVHAFTERLPNVGAIHGAFSKAKGAHNDLPAPTIKVTTSASSGKPYISWTAVDGATGYEVWTCGTKNGTYKLLYTAKADKLYITHTGAEVGNDYFYKVRAISGDVKGEFSAIKGVWCDLKCPIVKVTNRASDGKPVISWTSVEGATGYEVYRCSTKNGEYKWLFTAAADKLSVTHTGAAVGNDYFYKVRAIYDDNASCNSSFTSAKGVWVDLKRPTIKVTNRASDGKPVISWAKVDYAVGYKVYCADSSTGEYKELFSTTNPDKLSITHIGAVAGEDYFYKVVAVHKNSKCTSATSSSKGVYCDLARPTLTVDLNSNGKPYLSWTAAKGADRYMVYRSTDGETWKWMYTSKSNDFDVIHTGAKPGTTYYYKVVAICDDTSKGNSAYSIVKSVTVE